MSLFGEPTVRERMAWQVRRQIHRLAVAAFGAVEVWVPIAGTSLTRPTVDDPSAGIRAAHLTRNAAEAAVVDYTREARVAGQSWDEIATALGVGEDEFLPPVGERAFDEVTGRVDSHTQTELRWTCGTCEQRVTDLGPSGAHPDDNERGHTETCARRVTEIAAWREQTGRAD